jgi:exodeoxyribonuclease VII small subunit
VADVSEEEPAPGATFEELMARLEEITERLAAGDLGIEAAADLYEQAERLHALAAERLAQVQARIEALTQTPGSPSSSGRSSSGQSSDGQS